MTGAFSKRGRRTGSDFSGGSLAAEFAAGALTAAVPAEVDCVADLVAGDCPLTT